MPIPNEPRRPRRRQLRLVDAAGHELTTWPQKLPDGRLDPLAGVPLPGETYRLPNDSRPLVRGRGLVWEVVSVCSDLAERDVWALLRPRPDQARPVDVALDEMRTNLDNVELAIGELEDVSGVRRRSIRQHLVLRIDAGDRGELDLVLDLALTRGGHTLTAAVATWHTAEVGMGAALTAWDSARQRAPRRL